MPANSYLDWPETFDRTENPERTSKFTVSLAKCFNDLESTLEKIGADEYRYSFDAPSRDKDGRPYARAKPDDPGFVVRWTLDGDDFAVACDQYDRLRDNVRTVGLYLDEKRKMNGRPVTTGESEFANARLPSADDDAIATMPPAHEVLGVAPDASRDVIEAAARARKGETHPDVHGGNRESFERVKRAEDRLLDDQGVDQ
jgi:hypothetical protein